MGSEGIALHILNFIVRWRWVVNFMAQPLCSQYAFYTRLGGIQSWSGYGGKGKKSLCFCHKSSPAYPAHSSVTIL